MLMIIHKARVENVLMVCGRTEELLAWFKGHAG